MLTRKTDYVALWNAYQSYFPEAFLEDILRPTGCRGELLTRDYVRALRLIALLRATPGADEHFASLTRGEDALKLLHPLQRFRHSFDSVNLAARYDELKPEAQQELFENPDWMMTEKIDGFRVWLGFWNCRGADPAVMLHSRNYSDVDCHLNDYWDHILQTVSLDPGVCMVLDCECVFDGDISIARECGLIAEAKLGVITSLMTTHVDESLAIQTRYRERTGMDMVTFRLIHPLYYHGYNFTQRPLGDGMALYDEALQAARATGVNIHPIRRTNGPAEEKRALLESILASGGEGVVFHNAKGSYTASENRDKTSWVKLKRTVSASYTHEGLGDTIDAYVTGFKLGTPGTNREGLVSSLEFSIKMQTPEGTLQEHLLGVVSGLPAAFLKKNTVQDMDGRPTLNPVIYGMVGVLDGQCISHRNLRLKHPRLLEWRHDKTPEDCVMTQEWLESQVL